MSCANACGMGLCLFFTLSAYLITDLLLKERSKCQEISIRKFYIRRMLRIWPLYAVGVTIGLALAAVGHHASDITRFNGICSSRGIFTVLLMAGPATR